MHSLLLIKSNGEPFDRMSVRRVFEFNPRFSDLAEHPDGELYCQYSEAEHWAHIYLNATNERISIKGISRTSLQAMLLIQKGMRTALRLFDTDNSFDLELSSYDTVDELQAVIERASTSGE